MSVSDLYKAASVQAMTTVPYLAHGQRKREDMDTTGPDHGADA